MKYVFMGVTILLCLVVAHCPAQAPFTNVDAVHLPPRYFDYLGARVKDLDATILSRTEKHLIRLSKAERRLYAKLYKIDSAKAKALMADAGGKNDDRLGRL